MNLRSRTDYEALWGEERARATGPKVSVVTPKSIIYSIVVIILSALVLKSHLLGTGAPLITVQRVLPLTFPFFFLVILSVLSNWLGKKVSFLRMSRGELAMVYIFSGFAVMLQADGHYMAFLFSLILGKYYCLISPTMKPYSLVVDMYSNKAFPASEDAIFGFMEGGMSVPWGQWIGPLLLWGLLFGGYIIIYVVLAAVFQKRWAEQERLVYGLTVPILAAANMGEGYEDAGYNYKNRLFLLGGIIPFILWMFTTLHKFFPGVPTTSLSYNFAPLLGKHPVFQYLFFWPGLYMSVSPIAVALGYLIPTDITFSVWVGYALQRVLGAILWSTNVIDMGGWYAGGLTHAHGWGTSIGIAVYLTWLARHNIVSFFTEGFSTSAEEEPSIQYSRMLTIGVFISFLYIVLFWKIIAGLNWFLALWTAILPWFFGISLARLRVESSVPWTISDMHPSPHNVLGVKEGTLVDPKSDLNLHVFTTHVMWSLPSATAWTMEALKIGDVVGAKDSRKIVICVVAMFVAAVVITPIIVLPTIYDVGGGMTDQVWYASHGYALPVVGGYTLKGGKQALILGALIVFVLGILRSSYVWWPLSPIGYVAATQQTIFTFLPGSFLVAWGMKSLIQRYGGRTVLMRLLPFFVGMAVIDIVLQGLGQLISILQAIL